MGTVTERQAVRPHSKIADIQKLRAVACLMVLVQHSSLASWVFDRLPGNPTLPLYLGVYLFFVISGYVVTRSLFRHELRPVIFLVRRFLRLAPAIAAFLLFTAVVVAAYKPEQLGSLPSQSAAIFFGYLTLQGDPILQPTFGHMWSLSIEYQFYFAFAVLTMALVLARSRAPKPATLAASAALVLFAYVAGFTFLLSGTMLNAAASYVLGWAAYFLPLGVVLALLPERWIARLTPFRASLGWAAFLAAIALAMWCGSPMDPAWSQIRIGLVNPTIALLFTLVVACAAADDGKRHKARDPLVVVGDWSYSIYLFHVPVILLVSGMITTFAPQIYGNLLLFAATQIVALLALTFALAAFVYAYIEQPFIKLAGFSSVVRN